MQEPEVAAALQVAVSGAPQLPQEVQNLRCGRCPRCDSTNTKFCYYNNYNISQPRHYCKSCRRYWTKGGALRNIPIGGGTRKSTKRSAPASAAPHPKRAHTSSSPPAAAAAGGVPFTVEPLPALYPPADADRRMLDITGSFTSLLASNGHFASLLDSFHAGLPPGALERPSVADPACRPPFRSSLQLRSPSSDSMTRTAAAPPPPSQKPPMLQSFVGLQGEPGCWNGSGGWPDLTVYMMPGSSFQ